MKTDRAEDEFVETYKGGFDRALRVAARIVDSRAMAEDIAAETMVRVFTNWRRLRNAEHRDAWIARVATNLALDVVKRHPAPVQATTSARGHEEQLTSRLVVRQALARLSRRQRQAAALCWLADFSEADAALVMRCSAGTVKKALHRAMKALQDQHLDQESWSSLTEVAHVNP